ncbi:hypothetical protein [Rhizobium glycinendophyticum]|nr:hypothetical protein [Rhizobium glycinendophyticum]
MTLTGIAKASAIYMLAAILIAGGQVAVERLAPARHAGLVTEAGL